MYLRASAGLIPKIFSASTLQAASIVVDKNTPQVTTSPGWGLATAATDHYGTVSEFASTGGSVDVARFTPDLPTSGRYLVEAWNSCYLPRATDVPHDVHHAGGVSTVIVDQDPSSGSCAEWLGFGEFDFDAGSGGFVEISDAGVGGATYVGADAIRFTRTNVLTIGYATSDATRLYLEGTEIKPGEPLSVTLGWPTSQPCPTGGGICQFEELVVEQVSTTSIVAFLPPGLQPAAISSPSPTAMTCSSWTSQSELSVPRGHPAPLEQQAGRARPAPQVQQAEPVQQAPQVRQAEQVQQAPPERQARLARRAPLAPGLRARRLHRWPWRLRI